MHRTNSAYSDDRGAPSERARADRQLVSRVLEGDEAAASVLVGVLSPVVRSRISRLLRRSHHTEMGPALEDHIQEAFAALFAERGRLLAEWQPELGLSLPNFVGLIAERQTMSSLRSSRRRQRLYAAGLPREATDVEAEERRVMQRRLLQRLSTRLQQSLSPLGFELFLRLHVWAEPPERVRLQCGLSTAALHQWQSRLRKAARAARAELEAELCPKARGRS